MPRQIRCEKCGNDGTATALYVQVDARWDGKRWTLEYREDDGGGGLDCLACDHFTPVAPEDGHFPYGLLPIEPLEAWRALC